MDISVVVPFHNEQAYITRCVEALLSQDYPRDRYEIVLVDSNSTDRSADIVRQYSDVRLLSESTPGSYAARNRGVAASGGATIAFTDSDCAPDRTWLSTIHEELSVPGTQVVLGRARYATESLTLSMLANYETAKAAYVFSSRNGEIYYGYTNNMAVRRPAFDAVGPFEAWMRGADTIFVCRLAEAFSADAVRYSPQMNIQHLEMTSAWTWLGKKHLYGRSAQRSRAFARRRPLTRDERLTIYKETIRAHRYSVPQSMLLTALLGAGWLSYELGQRRPGRPAIPEAASR
ncbi:MAG TPA: glycosyltransferase [Vicinamibacterales bacterium]|jgi:glycosyltransferase involved in cell wall biosynthesis